MGVGLGKRDRKIHTRECRTAVFAALVTASAVIRDCLAMLNAPPTSTRSFCFVAPLAKPFLATKQSRLLFLVLQPDAWPRRPFQIALKVGSL